MDSSLPENGHHQSRLSKRRNYRRLYSATRNKKRVQIIRLGGKSRPKQLRIRVATLVLKLRRIKNIASSPLKLLTKLKRAYVSMMLNFAGHVSPLSDGKTFCGTRDSKGSNIKADMANTEFEKKLVLEMIKSFVA